MSLTGKSLFNFLLKALIAAASVYFIYFKVISRPDFEQMVADINHTVSKPEHLSTLALVMVLMFLNWLLETAKWKLLLLKFYSASWISCFRAVMSGVTVSIFTPNRTGEFAGRVLHLESGSRIKGALAAIIGSMNQLMITILAGGIALLFSLNNLMPGEPELRIVLGALLVAGLSGLIIVYFRLPLLGKILARINAFRKLNLYTRIFSLYSISDLMRLTIYSALRYLVFSFQFILMLQIFGIDFSYTESMRLISLIYLVMAVVPSVALSELTVRGSVALYFLSPLTGNSAGVLAATSLLWIINLAVPALIGSLAAFYFRLTR